MTDAPVYLDYNATAPIRPEVIALVSDVMGIIGNASSVHSFGQKARGIVETAREQVAALVGVPPSQIIFNSGATEADNTALFAHQNARVLISAIEHPAVMDAAGQAEKIPVTPDGVVDLDAYAHMLHGGEPPAMVSVMLVNSETGAIQPVKEIATLAKAKGALVHTDAAQAAGRIPVDFQDLGVDFMSLSAHKIAGPQGVGALIVRDGVSTCKFMKGGTQERRQRGGTINVAGVAGFGLAAHMAQNALPRYAGEITALRDRLEHEILTLRPEAVICAQNAPRVGNTSSISLPGVPAQTQLMALDLAGVAVSSGSACSSGSFKPSHVLQAMGMSEVEAATALRVSLGWATTADDVAHFIAAWTEMAARISGQP